MSVRRALLGALLGSSLLIPGAAWGDALDAALRQRIGELRLTGDPSDGRTFPAISAPLAQLGRDLFFSRDLSGDGDVACATCHHPELGGTDRLRLPIGANARDPSIIGPGRERKDATITLPRNTPTIFNVALWDQVLFYDGRVESLGKTQGRGGNDGKGIRTPDVKHGLPDPLAGDDLVAAQARFPVITSDEMRARHAAGPTAEAIRTELVRKLRGSAEWRERFADLFGDSTIDYSHVARALSAYERSQVFTATQWRAYVRGDNKAISKAAKRGAKLFLTTPVQGGAGCFSCHQGDFFTDEKFHVLAVPQIGPGRYDGGLGLEDHGRYTEEQAPGKMYAFRTPSLINISLTAPYGHSGAFLSLEEIISHHLNPSLSIARFDPSALPPAIDIRYWKINSMKALSELAWARAAGWTTLRDLQLSSAAVSDLVAFLGTLTDQCAEQPSCLAPWIPEHARGIPPRTRK